jgi:uncharacterized membrane protein
MCEGEIGDWGLGIGRRRNIFHPVGVREFLYLVIMSTRSYYVLATIWTRASFVLEMRAAIDKSLAADNVRKDDSKVIIQIDDESRHR